MFKYRVCSKNDVNTLKTCRVEHSMWSECPMSLVACVPGAEGGSAGCQSAPAVDCEHLGFPQHLYVAPLGAAQTPFSFFVLAFSVFLSRLGAHKKASPVTFGFYFATVFLLLRRKWPDFRRERQTSIVSSSTRRCS